MAAMQLPRPSEDDRQRFRALVPDDPRVEVKPMFGQLAAFVNGNMFLGLFGSDVGVKLAADDLATLRSAGGGSFGPEERPMAGFATVPPGSEPAWVAKALDHVASLPPKPRKK